MEKHVCAGMYTLWPHEGNSNWKVSYIDWSATTNLLLQNEGFECDRLRVIFQSQRVSKGYIKE